MDADFLARRREELISRAEDRGIDWRAREGMPVDDDHLMVIILAALLGVNFERALDPDVRLADLELEAQRAKIYKEIARQRILQESYSHAAGYVGGDASGSSRHGS